MRLKDTASTLDKYKHYIDCTEFLDNSPKSIELKHAVWCSIFGLYKRKSPSEIIKEVLKK